MIPIRDSTGCRCYGTSIHVYIMQQAFPIIPDQMDQQMLTQLSHSQSRALRIATALLEPFNFQFRRIEEESYMYTSFSIAFFSIAFFFWTCFGCVAHDSATIMWPRSYWSVCRVHDRCWHFQMLYILTLCSIFRRLLAQSAWISEANERSGHRICHICGAWFPYVACTVISVICGPIQGH